MTLPLQYLKSSRQKDMKSNSCRERLKVGDIIVSTLGVHYECLIFSKDGIIKTKNLREKTITWWLPWYMIVKIIKKPK